MPFALRSAKSGKSYDIKTCATASDTENKEEVRYYRRHCTNKVSRRTSVPLLLGRSHGGDLRDHEARRKQT
jgi:hypothetical protein